MDPLERQQLDLMERQTKAMERQAEALESLAETMANAATGDVSITVQVRDY